MKINSVNLIQFGNKLEIDINKNSKITDQELIKKLKNINKCRLNGDLLKIFLESTDDEYEIELIVKIVRNRIVKKNDKKS